MQKINFSRALEAQGNRIKYLLARMALSDPPRFWSTFADVGGHAYLTALWSGLGDELPPSMRMAPHGCSVEIHDAALVLRFPTPSVRGEPYALAFKTGGGRARVYLMEKADAAVAHLGLAMVVEITSEGRVALGPILKVDSAAFLAHIVEAPMHWHWQRRS